MTVKFDEPIDAWDAKAPLADAIVELRVTGVDTTSDGVIILTFENGRVVRFSTSEWMSVELGWDRRGERQETREIVESWRKEVESLRHCDVR